MRTGCLLSFPVQGLGTWSEAMGIRLKRTKNKGGGCSDNGCLSAGNTLPEDVEDN